MSKICSKCRSPGICCKEFCITHWDPHPRRFVENESREVVEKMLAENNYPFFIVGKKKGYWVFGCRNLSPEGRCTDYVSRPDLCKRYRAGTGNLCCESKTFGYKSVVGNNGNVKYKKEMINEAQN